MIFGRILGNGIKGLRKYFEKAMSSDSYVWIDLEKLKLWRILTNTLKFEYIPPENLFLYIKMTGLEPEKHKILEIACIITSPNLDVINEGINLVIHQPDDVLESMNEWCVKHHEKTGLTEASRKSKISLAEAETQVADYIKQYTNPDGRNYLTGNTVYMDRLFLMKYMPKVDSLFHYRLIDVSSIKTLCNHWYPEKIFLSDKEKVHRALDDIQESIKELKKYRSEIFK